MLARRAVRVLKPQTLHWALWLLVFAGHAVADDLATLTNEYLAGYWKARPSLAATPAGVHLHDNQLEDLTPAGRQQEVGRLRSFVVRLDRLDEKALSADARLDRALLLQHLRGELQDLEEGRAWQTRPQEYVTLPARAVHTLARRQFAAPGVRFAAAAARLQLVPRWLRQARLNLDNPPEIATRRALELAHASADYLETGILETAYEQGVDKKVAGRLRKAAKPAAQALRDFARWLEQDLLPRSKGNPVLGPERLAKRFHEAMGVQQTPDQVLASAEADLERTRTALARMPRREPVWLRPDETLRAYREGAARARKFVTEKRWAPLPQPDRLQFETAPAFLGLRRPTLDPAGPFEPGLGAYFYVPDASCSEAEALAGGVELGYPGAYLQREALSRVSDVVRKVFARTAFLNGWGPYARHVMIEERFGSDLAPTLRLELEAITDIRLHSAKWTPSEAVDRLVELGRLEREDAESTVRYALLHPGVLSSYYIGKLELLALRERKRKEWAPGFNLREFHEYLLGAGAY